MHPIRGPYLSFTGTRERPAASIPAHEPPMLHLRLFHLAALGIAACASPAAACTLAPDVTATAGPFSPAAVKASAVPAQQVRGGLWCDPAVLVLLSGNSVRATLRSVNGLRLIRTGGGSIGYTASADPAGTVRFAQGGTVDYMQNNLLNVLGLLGAGGAEMPFFIRPAAATLPGEGTYTDRVTIDWTWYLCTKGVNLAGVCLGIEDKGTNRRVTADITLTVAARSVTVTVTSAIVWDPTNEGRNPRDLPGSRRRVALGVANPDIVALDAGTLELVVPTPLGAAVALDGDKVTAGAAIRLAEGTPASGVAFTYAGPASTTDDVDFSADTGKTWTFTPAAGDPASEARITHIRLRPRNAMAAQSGFSVSIPYGTR